MDTTFSHSYECELLIETPTIGLPHYYYPGASLRGGRDGVLVEVRPEHNQPWLGTFAFGEIIRNGFTGIFTTPDPQRFCVVSHGQGYFVKALTPTEWEQIRVVPIIDVRCVRAQGIIVFANFTELIAYNQTGVKWRTKRLTWDDLKITEVTDTYLRGEFWDMRTEKTESFTVDLATGTHEGGVLEI
jgi:hypothetical protein